MATNLTIIGCGLAAIHLAREFRKLDKTSKLTIITHDDGVFYSKPQLSLGLSMKRDAAALIGKDAEGLSAELNAEMLINTEVTKIDASQNRLQFKNNSDQQAQEQWHTYDKLALAVGARPRNLHLQGDAVDSVHQVNNLHQYSVWQKALQNVERVAVIGAGLVGTEFAHDCAKTGKKVEVFSPDQQPLQALVPAEIAREVAISCEEIGVKWHWGSMVSGVTQADNAYKVHVGEFNSDTEKCYEVDVVLSAVGLSCNCFLAKASGLETNHGIVVNEYLETSQENIYAIGDCAEILGHVRMYVQPIMHAARALAKTITGERTVAHFPLMPITIKTACHPVCVLLPPKEVAGTWKVSADDSQQIGFYDKDNQCRGFALGGADAVKQRAHWLKLVVV